MNMEYCNCVKNILKIEEQLDIYNETILGYTIWPYIRKEYREKYIQVKTSLPPLSNHAHFNAFLILKSTLYSLFHIIKAIVVKRVDNLFVGFPRLEMINNKYMDKFIDPLIFSSNIGDNFIYIERGRSGRHAFPRYLEKNVIWSEFIDNLSIISAYILFPCIGILYRNTFSTLINKVNKFYITSYKENVNIILSIIQGLVKTYLIKKLLQIFSIKRCFITAAPNFYPYIASCKSINVPIYEIQHGITVSETATYSQYRYHFNSSPDFFLTFGEVFMKNMLFGIPLGKMINIGCAFKSHIQSYTCDKIDNTFLILSEPQVSDKIIDASIILADLFPMFFFNLRLHPLEKLNICQLDKISQKPNLKLVDSLQNSMITCMMYQGVLGENTTVLYEAVSVGVKAARIYFNGLHPNSLKDEPEGLFFNIYTPNDFINFVNFKLPNNESGELFYSRFNKHLFNSILLGEILT